MAAVMLLFWYLPNREEETSATPTTEVPNRSASAESIGSGPPPAISPSPDVPAEQIQASIDSQIAQIEKLPDQRKLSELEKNLKRLDKIATPESVDEVTTTIASTLGLDHQIYHPKEADDGPFDPSTAQIQDVIRVKSEDGGWNYESVLVDAQGRTTNVTMTSSDGQTTYETFQNMKKFPMAEGIYRSLVMPMMQKMIEAEEIAKKAALRAERAADTSNSE
jgi:hypothetical protein